MIFIFNENCKEAFKKLKAKLTFTPIFNYYNSEWETILKLDTLDNMIANILLFDILLCIQENYSRLQTGINFDKRLKRKEKKRNITKIIII